MNRVLGAYWVFGNDEQPFKSIWHIEGTVMIRSEGEYPMPDWL